MLGPHSGWYVLLVSGPRKRGKSLVFLLGVAHLVLLDSREASDEGDVR